MPRVTVLAGGVGGARFTRGLLACLPAADVTIVGNVGDDLEHWGLSISPDLDTLLYTLTGRIHPEQGWGVAGDTREAMAVVAELGGADWFILGDRDIGLHLVRSERLRAGEPLSAVTADFARRYGLEAAPAPGERRPPAHAHRHGRAASWRSRSGSSAGARPIPCSAVRFEGVPGARPAPGVLEAIASAERIVLAPSNPFVSLDPILAVDGVRAAVEARRERCRRDHADDRRRRPSRARSRGCSRRSGTRSPPSASPASLAPLAAGFVLDSADEGRAADVRALGLRVACVPTLMRDARRAPPRSPAPRSSCERRRRHRPARASGARPGRRSRRVCWLAAAERCAGGLRDGDIVCVAQKAVSKVEGRSVALASVTPSPRARRDRRRRGRSAHDRADPRRERAHRPPPRRVPDLRDPPRLRLRRGRRRPLERGRGRRRDPAAARSRRLGAPAARRLRRDGRGRA